MNSFVEDAELNVVVPGQYRDVRHNEKVELDPVILNSCGVILLKARSSRLATFAILLIVMARLISTHPVGCAGKMICDYEICISIMDL